MVKKRPLLLLILIIFFQPLNSFTLAEESNQSQTQPAETPHVQLVPAQPETPRYKVEADFSKPIGDASQVTDFFGAGGSLYFVSNNADDPVASSWREMGFNQISFETLHLEDPFERWIKVSVDEKKQVQVEFSDYDRYMRMYLDNLKAKPFVYLGNMPRALSSCPDTPAYAVCKPANLKLWQDFVRKIVKHNIQKFRLKGINYGVMGEPDHPDSWHGSLQDHIEFYAATYRAVKAEDKTARMGGPAAMSWKKTQSSAAAVFTLEDWIRALAEFNKKNPEKAAGLDYVSWQDYGWAGSDLRAGADAVSAYLKKNGFDPDTPKMLAGSGWGSWASDYLDENQSLWQRASFVLDTMVREFQNPDQRKFHQAIYYSFYFNDYWVTPDNEKELQRQRDVSLIVIPKQGRFKLTPAFAAFQMMKNMSVGYIVPSSAEKPLEAMASVDEAGQRAVVTVVNPTPELAIAEFSLKNIPLNMEEVKATLKSIDEFHSVDGYGLEDGFEIEPKVEAGNVEVAIFIKPYGSLQIIWQKPEPPKEEPVTPEDEDPRADDDIRPVAHVLPDAGSR